MGAIGGAAIAVGGIVVGVGATYDTSSARNPAGFYVAGCFCIGFGLLLILGYFVFWPVIVVADTWRARRMAEAHVKRAEAALVRAAAPTAPAPRVVHEQEPTLDLGTATGPVPVPELRITSARYGVEGKGWEEVTGDLNKRIKDGRLDVAVEHDDLFEGIVPPAGEPKMLQVEYKLGGVAGWEQVYEHERLQIPRAAGASSAHSPGVTQIVSATYGVAPSRVVDVRPQVERALNAAGTLRAKVGPELLENLDPAKGYVKEIEVWYVANNKRLQKKVMDGHWLELP